MPLPDSAHRVRLEGIDFAQAFPALRLFDSFRMALQPTKMLLGMLILILIYFTGIVLDFIWGQEQIFRHFVEGELVAFHRLAESAVRLDFGLGSLLDRSEAIQTSGMIGAMLQLVIFGPGALWSAHPWFFLLLCSLSLVITMVLGGAIARLAATQACSGESVGLIETMRFTWPRAAWYVIAPLIPLSVAGVIWLILAIAGAVLFNVSGLNVIGGFFFFLFLAGGLIASCLLIFSVLGSSMMPAALAVEGTDAFDVVSRVFTFLIYRPAKYLFLIAGILIYGAFSYFIIAAVLLLTLWITKTAASTWCQELLAISPTPAELPLHSSYLIDESHRGTYAMAAWLIKVWSGLLMTLSFAYAISYFFTTQTWLYLILRRDVDGTDFADLHPDQPESAEADEKIEPGPPPAGLTSEVDSGAAD